MSDSTEPHLAGYAIRSCDHGGRVVAESDDPLRSPFALDRHRVIESTAFRRLEGKTQVFAARHGDHFRTRLTHTLEVAQVARTLAVGLRANETLAEVITLAHDLGHPPFGHAGEAALQEAMSGCGGFNHNAHSLRVVDYLEHPYPAFRGLNLTGETRAGLFSHVTRYDQPSTTDEAGATRAAGLSPRDSAVGVDHSDSTAASCDLPTKPSIEAQIASMADRIAYNLHDLEDAIGASYVTLEDLAALPLWSRALAKTCAQGSDAVGEQRGGGRVLSIHAVRRVVLDGMLHSLLTDVISTSLGLLKNVETVVQVRQATKPLIALSSSLNGELSALEKFLIERVYRHADVTRMDDKGKAMVLKLFAIYRDNPKALPSRFAKRVNDQGIDRVVCDYLAGMTDNFCTTTHADLVT